MHYTPIHLQVVPGRTRNVKALLERGTTGMPIEAGDTIDGLHRLVKAVHDKASHAVRDDFGHGSAAPGDHRRATGQGLDHDEAERLRPVDGKEQRVGVAQKLVLVSATDLTEELDKRPGRVQQRFDYLRVIVALLGVDLGGDLERPTRAAGDFDGSV